MTTVELSALVDRVKALEELVDESTKAIFRSANEPTIRVRIAHTHTIKDGWRLSETTVEWAGVGSPNWDQIESELVMAHRVGVGEAISRGAIESVRADEAPAS